MIFLSMKTMLLRCIIIVLAVLFGRSFGFESILSRCCNLGVRWGWENRTCSRYPAPVQGIAAEHQPSCLLSINSCCRRNYRERECIDGHVRAKTGLECLAGRGLYGNYVHDCCEGCKLGLLAGSLGLTCEFESWKNSLGPPWDSSMTKCCLQAGGSPATPTRSPVQIQTTRYSVNPTPTGNEIPTSRFDQCPVGFEFNPRSQVCDDIDECLLPVGATGCPPYKQCQNTIGSYLCVDDSANDNATCPPGYRANAVTGECDDVDECAEGFDICVRETHYCINTPGGFDCKSKKEFSRYNCPAGYKFNNNTLNCEDVDECRENIHSCDSTSETCRNTNGAYECDSNCLPGYRFDTRNRVCQDIDECREGIHDCEVDVESCVNVPGSYQCHQLESSKNNTCPPGYEPNQNYTFLCQDTDECATARHTCTATENCINEVGGYRCEAISEEISDEEDAQPVQRSTDVLTSLFGPTSPRPASFPTSRTTATVTTNGCQRGYKAVPGRNGQSVCVDIDECQESNPCDRTQLCQNSVGSYTCHCRIGYYRDPMTRACLDINECQTGQHTCSASQRCDNSPGSFTCIRITGCGTGYTLNSATGQCEDDDECLFGTHDCDSLGPGWACRNTLGSFRCEKEARSCPPGLALAPNGECRSPCSRGFEFGPRGDCIDIDECKERPGIRSICAGPYQCVNTMGSYRCIPKLTCPFGHEADANSTRCNDVDECERGLHNCKPYQECENRAGGFICRCSQGYQDLNGSCEDVNECTSYGGQVCASNAECHNTPGSYRCLCKEGFEQGPTDNRTCVDVDECLTITGLCQQNCINTWGSFKCSCGAGFTLNTDGRSCHDIDECAQARSGFLCVGQCVNTHGSYKCDCPDGYNLGPDSRTCIDVNECERDKPCRDDEYCLNTRGGFRCNRQDCPSGYIRDRESDRCKRVQQCLPHDMECLRQPLTISMSFLSFTSNVRIPPAGYVDIFNMRGPSWQNSVTHFRLDVKASRAPGGIPVASRQFFLLRRPSPYQAVIALARPLAGPQDVELELSMDVSQGGRYSGTALAKILIVVTRYEF